MSKATHVWKLDSPKMCRDFLKRVLIGPKKIPIKFLQQADGKQISIDDATDEQVLQVANELALGASKRADKK